MATLHAKAGRSCPRPRCPRINCDRHTREVKRRELDQHRGTFRERGFTTATEKRMKAHKAAHPLCVHHELGLAMDHGQRDTRTTVAGVVADHIIPHRGERRLLDAEGNLQTLCRPCDNAKRARENGLTPCQVHGEHTATVTGVTVCVACGQGA